ncbi:actin-like protein; 86009-89485 [Arabidopsis thaliana]|nr:actin-like protein; 86009-89485 [Arabidopsis thaliana]
MAFVSRIRRQSDYNTYPSSIPIVIDNGASYFRIGWAGETEPRVVFRNIVQRPRHKATGETVTIVGDLDPSMMKYFDCTRSGPRSPFDSNVVYQFEIMEYILDYAFDRLGANGSGIDHPILITECACNPVQSRSKMAELLFETYGVPAVGMNLRYFFATNTINYMEFVKKMELFSVLDSRQHTPFRYFVDGEPIYKGSSRTNIGGYHVTDYLKQLLSRFTWEKAEDLKLEHCYIAPDYASEIRLFQEGRKEAEEKTSYWQLPWIPPPTEVPPSEEEIARKAAIREKQGQRLREMAEAKRVSKINDMENQLISLRFLLKQVDQVEEDDIPTFLSDTGYASRQELESTITKVTQSLRKARGEPKNEPAEYEENPDSLNNEKYPLMNVPDDILTPEQLKDKKRQMFLKTTAEGRLRARQKRNEEELEKEKRNQLEEERRRENPESYLEELQAQYKEVLERVEQKKRLKTNGSSNGNNKSGGIGRGERLSAAQRERMRLLTTAAFDRGKGEDTFGSRDEDWQLYKLMSKDNDDDDEQPDSDEAELARLSSRLQEIDPTFVQKVEGELSQTSGEVPRVRPLTEEDYKIVIGIERFRCPEILFHPNLIGIDQVGLDEMAGTSIRRLPHDEKELEERLTSSILMTGGCSLLPGMNERLECGIRMIRPCGSPINVVRAMDPVLDAWRGASAFAANLNFLGNAFTKMDYDEKGEDWLRNYQIRYNYL